MLPVILVHAFPLDARMWATQLAAAPADLKLHAIDLPGFGRSASTRPCRTMSELADAIHQASLPFNRFAICGLSMGGYAAFAYWRQHGVDGRLAGLVLADTKAEADTPEGQNARNATLRLVRERGLGALADQLLPKLLAPAARRDSVREVRGLIEAQQVETVAAATEAMRDRLDSSALLPGMNLPVLVVGGSLDGITPPEGMQAMADRLPQGRWRAIDGAGHLSNIERPDAFNEAVFDFLRSLERP